MGTGPVCSWTQGTYFTHLVSTFSLKREHGPLFVRSRLKEIFVKNKSYIGLIQLRQFRLLWLGQTTSQLGNTFYDIALIWLALQITHQNYLSIGLVIFARFLPYLAFGLIGGAYSDRWNRKYTMLACDSFSALVVLLLPLANMLGQLNLWELAGTAFLLSTLRVFFAPSLQSSLPDVVPEELLSAANGLIHSSYQVAEVVGPLVATTLFVFVAPISLFLFDSLTFFVSVGTLLFVHLPVIAEPEQTVRPKIIHDILGTFLVLRDVPIVLVSILLFGIEVLTVAGITRLGLPAYTIQVLHGGAQIYGLLVSGMAFGTVIGGLLAGLVRTTEARPLGLMIFVSWIGYGIFLMLLPLTGWLPLAIAFTMLAGGVGAFVDVLMVVLIQRHTPREAIGRIFSLWSTVANISESASSPLIGLLFGFFGLVPVFVSCSLFTALVGLLSVLGLQRIKPRAQSASLLEEMHVPEQEQTVLVDSRG